MKNIVLDDSVTYLGEAAFAGCVSLEKIYLSPKITVVDPQNAITVFLDCVNLTIRGAKGSYIEEYARERSIPFENV